MQTMSSPSALVFTSEAASAKHSRSAVVSSGPRAPSPALSTASSDYTVASEVSSASLARSDSSLTSFSSTDRGVYVPVHRRAAASASACSSPCSTSAFSSGLDSEHARTSSPSSPLPLPSSTPQTYSMHRLFALSHSPLCKLSTDAREKLHAACPEIATNRKQRKAIEFYTVQHYQALRERVREEKSASRKQHRELKETATRNQQQRVSSAKPIHPSSRPARHLQTSWRTDHTSTLVSAAA